MSGKPTRVQNEPIPEAVRDAFEAWAKSQGRSTNMWAETGEYTHYDTQRCWEAWQAALTAAQQQGQAVACAHCGGPQDSAMHSFSDRYLEAQGMYHEFVPNTASPPSTPVGVEGLAESLRHAAGRWTRESDYLAKGFADDYGAGQRHAFLSCANEMLAIIEHALAQQPAAVNDLNARRAAFVAERAMRYREGGMAIEQARIHAETDAAHMEALAASQQPTAVDEASLHTLQQMLRAASIFGNEHEVSALTAAMAALAAQPGGSDNDR